VRERDREGQNEERRYGFDGKDGYTSKQRADSDVRQHSLPLRHYQVHAVSQKKERKKWRKKINNLHHHRMPHRDTIKYTLHQKEKRNETICWSLTSVSASTIKRTLTSKKKGKKTKLYVGH
jgi:hypothetical protein